MKMEIYVAGVSHEVWFRESRDERQVTLLNCLDPTAHEGLKLKQTFDYVPTKEETGEIDMEKLEGCSLVLGVEEIKAANGGRLKVKGKIDRASVPKQALRYNGAGSAPAALAPWGCLKTTYVRVAGSWHEHVSHGAVPLSDLRGFSRGAVVIVRLLGKLRVGPC